MKKLAMMIMAVVLVLSFSVTAFAAVPAPRGGGYGAGYGWCGGAGGFMWDDDGNFLSKEAFEERLDKAIEDGLIRSEDRGAFIERYDYCAENGGGAFGIRGGCGMGRRWA